MLELDPIRVGADCVRERPPGPELRDLRGFQLASHLRLGAASEGRPHGDRVVDAFAREAGRHPGAVGTGIVPHVEVGAARRVDQDEVVSHDEVSQREGKDQRGQTHGEDRRERGAPAEREPIAQADEQAGDQERSEQQRRLARDRRGSQEQSSQQPAPRGGLAQRARRRDQREQHERNLHVHDHDGPAVEDQHAVDRGERPREQRRAASEVGPCEHCDKYAAESADRCLQQLERQQARAEDPLDHGHEVCVERTEDQDVLAHPVAARDRVGPGLVEPAVHRRDREEGIVRVDLLQMQEPQQQGDEEYRPKREPVAWLPDRAAPAVARAYWLACSGRRHRASQA